MIGHDIDAKDMSRNGRMAAIDKLVNAHPREVRLLYEVRRSLHPCMHQRAVTLPLGCSLPQHPPQSGNSTALWFGFVASALEKQRLCRCVACVP